MKYTIRPYTKDDYKEVKAWWDTANEPAPTEDMLPEESTLILELEDKPALCIAVYLTNCKEVCYLENFVGNPELKGEERRKASQLIVDSACSFAKAMGFKRIMCLSYRPKLEKRYQELGMSKTMENLTSFVRVLS